MTATVTPSSPVEVLEPWIIGRLHPLADYDPATRRVRSDYDLNPEALRRPAGPLHPAAVLAPLVERPDGLTVLLTRRADTLARHSGQIAFPGGRADPGEAPWQTALREAQEEIGLDPSFVRVAGLADPYETVTGFSITPVVGFVRPGFQIEPHAAEVAEVFESPFAFLMDPANHERRVHEGTDGLRRHYYAMPHEGRFIWGATAGMLRALYERLFGELKEAA
jgi:8-oxo-dGTP pyrophosphatase MutT (NUDIX family)